MAPLRVSRQDFIRNADTAEAAAVNGPVFITEDGEPRSVIVDFAEYRRLASTDTAFERTSETALSLVDVLAVPEEEYFDWQPPRLSATVAHLDADP